jgi:hypothetical protein
VWFWWEIAWHPKLLTGVSVMSSDRAKSRMWILAQCVSVRHYAILPDRSPTSYCKVGFRYSGSWKTASTSSRRPHHLQYVSFCQLSVTGPLSWSEHFWQDIIRACSCQVRISRSQRHCVCSEIECLSNGELFCRRIYLCSRAWVQRLTHEWQNECRGSRVFVGDPPSTADSARIVQLRNVHWIQTPS